MSIEIFEQLTDRFENSTEDAVTVSKKEWVDLASIFSQLVFSNKTLTTSIFDVLTYRLGIKFDRFSLDRVESEIMDEDGSIVSVVPLTLKLFLENKIVFMMEGGMTGNKLNDLMLLLDKLLTLNIAERGGVEPIDLSVTMADGFVC